MTKPFSLWTLRAAALAAILCAGHFGGALAKERPATPAGPAERPLQLQLAGDRAQTAALLASASDDLPPSVHAHMLGSMLGHLRDNMSAFLDDFSSPAEAGSGDGGGSGGLAFIAGLLGFFPGFGLGHLISGHIGGFALFLVVDLIIVGVFFIAFPVIAFNLWYLPGLIVLLVERVVEAFSAANAATSPPTFSELAAGNDGRATAAASLKLPLFRF